MENESVTGPDGMKWTRSKDGRVLTCENGAVVIGLPEMSTDYLLSVAYSSEQTQETSPGE